MKLRVNASDRKSYFLAGHRSIVDVIPAQASIRRTRRASKFKVSPSHTDCVTVSATTNSRSRIPKTEKPL